MSEIVASVNELSELNKELKRLRDDTRKINKRKKEIENTIKTYLESHNQPGVKYKNIAIIAEPIQKRTAVKKTEKSNIISSTLSAYGIHAKQNLVDELMDRLKGDLEDGIKIKVKDITKKT
jgi:hypothetical protein